MQPSPSLPKIGLHQTIHKLSTAQAELGGKGWERRREIKHPLGGEPCDTAMMCRISSPAPRCLFAGLARFTPRSWQPRRSPGTLLCRDTFLSGRRMLSAWLPASPRRTATQIAVELQKEKKIKRRSPTPSSLCHRLSGRIDGCHYRNAAEPEPKPNEWMSS